MTIFNNIFGDNPLLYTPATVAAMKAMDTEQLPDSALLHLKGWLADGDTDQGLLYYDRDSEEVADNILVFAPNSGNGRFIRIDRSYINVEWAGAISEERYGGQYDSQAAIRSLYLTKPATLIDISGATVTAPNGGTGANVIDGNSANVLTTSTAPGTTDNFVLFSADVGTLIKAGRVVFQNFSISTGSTKEIFVQISSNGTDWTYYNGRCDLTTTAAIYDFNGIREFRHIRVLRVGTTDLGSATFTLGEMQIYGPVTRRKIVWPSRTYDMSIPLDCLAETDTVAYGAHLRYIGNTSGGGFILVKEGDDYVTWRGGKIDANFIGNINVIACGNDPVAPFVDSRYIRFSDMTLMNGRIDPATQGSFGTFGGGGKGITTQFDLTNAIFSNIHIIDCDIGIAHEAAASDNNFTRNILFDNITIEGSKFTPIYLGGSRKSGVGSLDNLGGDAADVGHAIFRNVHMIECGRDLASTSYGLITANYAAFVDGEFSVKNSNTSSTPVTLFRGNATRSRIKIRAAVDYLDEAFNFTPYSGAANASSISTGNEFEAYWTGTDLDGPIFTNDVSVPMQRSKLRFVYHSSTGTPTLMSGFTSLATVRYYIEEERTSRIVSGQCDLNASPLLPSAGNQIEYFNRNIVRGTATIANGANSDLVTDANLVAGQVYLFTFWEPANANANRGSYLVTVDNSDNVQVTPLGETLSGGTITVADSGAGALRFTNNTGSSITLLHMLKKES